MLRIKKQNVKITVLFLCKEFKVIFAHILIRDS
jgi:hypothetical protein